MPSTNITDNFEAQWSYEVKQAYQQAVSKLRGCVRVQTGVVGDTYNFPKLDVVEATTKARGALVTFQNSDHGVAPASLEDAYASRILDKLDDLKSKADYRREYVESVAMGLARKTDDIVIAALDAGQTLAAGGSPFPFAGGAITEVSGATGTVFEALLDASRNLNDADVPMYERDFVHSPGTLDLAMRETEFTSADFMLVKNLVMGEIDTAIGFKWVNSTRLQPTAATGAGSPAEIIRQNYALHRRACGLAIGADITTELNYIPERVAHLAVSFLSMGSVIIDGPGIVRVLIDE